MLSESWREKRVTNRNVSVHVTLDGHEGHTTEDICRKEEERKKKKEKRRKEEKKKRKKKKRKKKKRKKERRQLDAIPALNLCQPKELSSDTIWRYSWLFKYRLHKNLANPSFWITTTSHSDPSWSPQAENFLTAWTLSSWAKREIQ